MSLKKDLKSESGSLNEKDDRPDTNNIEIEPGPASHLDTAEPRVDQVAGNNRDIEAETFDDEAVLGGCAPENEQALGQTGNDLKPIGKDSLQNESQTHQRQTKTGQGYSGSHFNEPPKSESLPLIQSQTLDNVVGQNVTRVNAQAQHERQGPSQTCQGHPNIKSNHGYSLPLLVPRKVEIGFLPPCIGESVSPRYNFVGQRSTIPPTMIRAATLSWTSSTSTISTPMQGPLSYVDYKSRSKLVTWEEAMQSRPPLRIDMDGPTPCTYSPRNKPLKETNAPSYTFGSKCQPIKNGGGRTSWLKSWFQTPHVWLNKVDFARDQAWPTPSLYSKRVSLGANNSSSPSAPAYTIQERKTTIVNLPGVVDSPSPNCYSRQNADGQTLKRSSSFTHGQRRGGTVLWSYGEVTPGPAYYDNSKVVLSTHPAFTIQGARREKSFELGPFSTF